MGEAHYEKGRQLAAYGDTNTAAEEYRNALLFAPDNTDYQLSLATTLIDAGRLNEAQSHIEELLEEDPTNPGVNLLRARLALKRNRLNIATEYYQRAVYEYWPANKMTEQRQARWELADLLAKTEQRNALIAELIQLYSDAPHNPQERAKIGSMLLANGASSEALQVFRNLTKQEPNDAAAHFGLAQVYSSLGDFVSARHEYQRAAHLDPHDPKITESLGVTNEVIDMDPDLPSISSQERFRRSQNLLGRVLKDLRECPATPTPVATTPATPPPVPATKKLLQQLKDRLAAPLGSKATKSTSNGTSAPGKQALMPTTGKSSGTAAQSDMEKRLAAAQNLLATAARRNEDSSAGLQSTAQGLWRDRAQICGATPVDDQALEAVMARMSHE